MGAATKQTQTLFRLPEFRAEDVADPELFARKMNEMRRQLETASLMLNSINDVLTQDVAESDSLAYDSTIQRWVNGGRFLTNRQELDADITLDADRNGVIVGPYVINSGASLTIADGAALVVV